MSQMKFGVVVAMMANRVYRFILPCLFYHLTAIAQNSDTDCSSSTVIFLLFRPVLNPQLSI